MIKLIDKWYIDADNYQYILQEDTEKFDKKGNRLFKNQSYHPNIESAIKKLANSYTLDYVENNDVNLVEALKEIRSINARFEELLIKSLGEKND